MSKNQVGITFYERQIIEVRLRGKWPFRKIARYLHREHSVVANGGEAARHVELRTDYNIGTYFCDPYKSWQKGGVENVNGLIRQYLPNEVIQREITPNGGALNH